MKLTRFSDSAKNTRLLVLDASAFIMGVDPFGLNARLMTTEEVIDEVKKRDAQLRIRTAMEQRRLDCRAPSSEYIETVRKIGKSSGDLSKLSQTDISVLALALELKKTGDKPIIVSDDYAVQNVAEMLNVGYEVVSTRGIRSRIKWRFFCIGCDRKFGVSPDDRKCPDCGSDVKRRPISKIDARKISSGLTKGASSYKA